MDWSAVGAIAAVIAAVGAAVSAIASWRAVVAASAEAKAGRVAAEQGRVDARDARAAEIMDRAPVLDLSEPRAMFGGFSPGVTVRLHIYSGSMEAAALHVTTYIAGEDQRGGPAHSRRATSAPLAAITPGSEGDLEIEADDYQSVDPVTGRLASLTYRWFEVGVSFRASNGATVVQTHDWFPRLGERGEIYLRDVTIDSNVPGATPRVIRGPD